ncbi:LysR family transcriptional regulator [Rhizobium sp.]|jgi:DNA-binding transcriptional LysR family regulator|uniref:LysR family transcriptional regulator n=1 Tax=Rhizobium sp. TaxID=391 RepID=UPI000E98B73D|nr:LysR family transcriptional regulator [Rhizobium sp.]
MTLEQLTIFIAVAERQHITRAAEAIGLTPSAVSSAIRALETNHDVLLFDRVGRGIELTQTGRLFLDEARATVARANSAELILAELGGLKRGKLNVQASQTVASHWLPRQLMRFHALYPDIELALTIGNTTSVADAVEHGMAEIGFVEADVASDRLAQTIVAEDAMVIVTSPGHPLLAPDKDPSKALAETTWIMREQGSGTRAFFEQALRDLGVSPEQLKVALSLPSNEAVLSAVMQGGCAAALSTAATAPLIEVGRLEIVPIRLASRHFSALRHRERRLSEVARQFLKLCGETVSLR